MSYQDPTYREQSGPDAEIARRSGDNLSKYLNNAWDTYTPTWGAASGSPVVGNGILQGWYKRLGSLCWGHITFGIGSTTGFGTGQNTFTVPFPATTQFANFGYIGVWNGFHSAGSNHATTSAQMISTTVMRFVYPATWSNGTETAISGSAGSPWSWSSGDAMDVQFTYEVAK